MTAPFLINCLKYLRAEFDMVGPDRDKGADGWIGDTAHQGRTSDHNPDALGRVLAIDIDVTGPWSAGTTLGTYVSFIVARCVSGQETRLEYVIFNRLIYSRTSGWKAEKYAGADPHTGHAHFSGRHDHTGQNSAASWALRAAAADQEETDMDVQDILNGLHRDLQRGPGHAAGADYPAGESGLHADIRVIADAATAQLDAKLDAILAAVKAIG